MIDMHCHILPGLDDGARDMEEAVAMARALADHGFQAVVATPHIAEVKEWLHPPSRIRQSVDALNQNLKEEGVSLTVHPGAEYHLDRSFPELVRARFPVTTLGESLYMMIELPAMHWPEDLEYSVWARDSDSDEIRKFLPFVRPVIAHPERNQEALRDISKLRALRNFGYLFQVNLESVLGFAGRPVVKFIKKMAGEGMIDFIGTDGHSSGTLVEMLPRFRKKVEKVIGKENAERALELNPRELLAGKSLDI